MGQDIRELLQNRPEIKRKMPRGHEDRFEKKLKLHFSKEANEQKSNTSFFWLKIAAVAIVFFAVGSFGYHYIAGLNDGGELNTQVAETNAENETNTTLVANQPKITLGDLSPEFKKVENFYLTGINVQLASLEVNDDNKELIDGYMKRIAELDIEYNRLNNELTETGPTEATINALIDNLKLRLDLLFKLKNKLKELKNLDDEKFNSQQA